jgi:hypothetical protein
VISLFRILPSDSPEELLMLQRQQQIMHIHEKEQALHRATSAKVAKKITVAKKPILPVGTVLADMKPKGNGNRTVIILALAVGTVLIADPI